MSESVSNRRSVEKPSELLNDLFTSNSVDKILEFYSSFDTVDGLIRWMKERPKGRAEIYEIEGNKDIIVVIPTANFNGEYARLCRDDIFRGLQMVFVESGGKNDPYFNFAHNANKGISVAMKFTPKWIVVSGDDVEKIDDIERLRCSLLKINNEEATVVHTLHEGTYHSRYAIISTRTFRRNIILYFKGELERKKLELESRYNIKYIVGSTLGIYPFLYRSLIKVKYSGSLTILSYSLALKLNGAIFDENYINGTEDIDLAWRLSQEGTKIAYVDFKIGDVIGGTLGPYNLSRRAREIANACYMNAKIIAGDLKLS